MQVIWSRQPKAVTALHGKDVLGKEDIRGAEVATKHIGEVLNPIPVMIATKEHINGDLDKAG